MERNGQVSNTTELTGADSSGTG